MAIQLPANMHPNTVEAINALLTAYNMKICDTTSWHPARIEAARVVNQARKAWRRGTR